jgi:uracil-DNA glycosylase
VTKKKFLENIALEISNCQICQVGKSGLPVAGEGNPDAEVVFIGEAPGKQEAKAGRPFIGPAGKILRFLINEVGLKEEGVYITSPVKYLPDRGTPTKEDINHGRIHLNKQLEVINPKFIVLLGSVAAQALLEEKFPITQVHGTIIEKNDRKYFLTFHPAAGLHYPPNRILLKEDFKLLKRLLNT